MTGQFAKVVLKHDVSATATLACHIDATPAANDAFNWQHELDNDPDYLVWIEARADEEEMRHARW